MRKQDANRLRMYLAVKTTLEKFQPVWNTSPILSTRIGQFNNLVTQLQDSVQEQIRSLKGYAEVKEEHKKTLTKHMMRIIGGIQNYLYDHPNHVLKAQVDYTPSNLFKIAEPVAKERLDNIVEIAESLIPRIQDYDVEQPLIDEAKTAIQVFEKLISSTRGAQNNRSAATLTISEQVREIQEFLKSQFDIQFYRHQGTDFYKEYQKSRMIIDYGNKSTQTDDQIVEEEVVEPPIDETNSEVETNENPDTQ